MVRNLCNLTGDARLLQGLGAEPEERGGFAAPFAGNPLVYDATALAALNNS